MPTVRVKENEPFEVAMRRFKRTVEKTGLLTELRSREYYEKPTAERKRKLAAAVKRHHKRLRSQMLPQKMYEQYQVTTLKHQITEDMKAAMRARDSARLSTVRLLLAGLKQKEVDERVELADADVVSIIERMIKQRRESIAQFEKASRQDLADKEKAEIGVLSAYLPQRMGDAEIQNEINSIISETGATGPKDMGKVMALLKPRLAGRADMGAVSSLVKSRLSG